MPSVNTEAISDQSSAVSDEIGATSCQSSALTPQASCAKPASGKVYWRSLDELADTAEFRDFVYREFPAGATDLLNSSDRRQFLKVMGASLALAGMGMSGCRRWPDEKIAPFANRPAGRTPGSPVHYATSMEVGGVASGLLVNSYDGRPTKIEGNPEHPINKGAADAHMQASVLDLYDPDRSQFVMHDGKKSDWNSFVSWAKTHFTKGKTGVAILTEATSSPSVLAMKQAMAGVLPATWYEYEPLNNDSQVKGTAAAFGSSFRPQYSFDKAKTIVALDSDFLNCGPASLKWTRDFAQGRRAEDHKSMNRLYAFESGLSLTGANADHRVALRSADVSLVAARIAAQVLPAGTEGLQSLAAAPLTAAMNAKQLDQVMKHLVDDLKANPGPSIVIAGDRQPAEVHVLVALINDALGNHGKTISYTPMAGAVAQVDSIKALAADISSGKVQTLVILGGNPVYNAPVDLKFADLLKTVSSTIHLSDYLDETSKLCSWHVNRAHYLEAWGDGRAYDGTIAICQPLIEPLFNGKSSIEVLAAISGDTLTAGYDIVRRTSNGANPSGDLEAGWRTILHDGFLAGSATPGQSPPRVLGQNLQQALAALQPAAAPKGDELEIVFAQDASLYDGRFANNGWLQEMPDPMSKLTWDNAVYINPVTAKARGLATGDMVSIKCNGRDITAAVMLMPGQFRGSMTVALGYGREFNGKIATGAGFNFYKLRDSNGMGFANATMTKTGDTYVLATTQDHHAVDTVGGKGEQERMPTLFREASLEHYEKNHDFARHAVHVVHRLSLWDEALPFQSHDPADGAKYAWGMSIDLNSCTGCGACVVACQAENNIPIVGKDQVARGREMHWIRIDRYFKGHSEEQPDAYVVSPVTCQHCENAPCEQVCPVAATTHDMDGLNVMVYNRCVGTRYCSNNCPYKVRKFNYFDYHVRGPLREQPHTLLQVQPDYYLKGSAVADPLKQMQFNPEVTVRMRGIMEKCTYCVQRITGARIEAKNAWVREKELHPNATLDQRVPIKDGAITPACAQSCPAQAIVFGDLNDRTSRVAQLHKHERSYQMLEELNTKPRTKYMAKLRNPAFGGHEETPAHH